MANREPLLTEADLMNPAVIKILEYFTKRLTKLRIANDKFDAEIHIRGRIAEIKEFNKIIKPKQPKESNHIKSAI